MLSNGNSSLVYNNYKLMPEIPSMIINRLLSLDTTSAQNLWKLLKYVDTKPLAKNNLTLAEKRALIWSPDKVNSEQQNLFNVFQKPLVSSSDNDAQSQTQLRIYRSSNTPPTNIMAVLLYQFDLITQEAHSMVYNENKTLVERTDLMEAYLLDCLNGADLSIGSSFFTFSKQMSNSVGSNLEINNSKSLFGRSVRIAMKYVNTDSGGCL